MTSFAPALKELYVPNKLQEVVLTGRPLLALIDKEEDFFGEWAKQPTLVGNPQNHSANFAQAQNAATSSTLKAFLVTRAKYYSFVTIDNETLKASANDKGAFAKALETEIDGGLNGHSNILSQYMYRSGWGEVGQIGSITGTTITLSLAGDAFNFEIGMQIVFATTLNASALNSATPVSVTAVNRSPGSTIATITISGTTGTPAINNFIFRAGDRDNSATPSRLVLSGLGAWVPSVGNQPGVSDSFFSVNRSSDSRLYGSAIDGTSMNIEDAILAGIEAATANGGTPDYVFINPIQYLALQRILSSKVQYIDLELEDVPVAFRGIVFQNGSGVVKVMSDIWCPQNRAFVCESKSMMLHSLGSAPQLFDTDGNVELRSATSDGVDVRIYSYAQLRVLKPSHFANVALGTP